MRFWNNFKYRCARDYIDRLNYRSRMQDEQIRFMIHIEGERQESFTPKGQTPRMIPFTDEVYRKTWEDALRKAKMEAKEGHSVEVWELKEKL